MKYSEHEIGQLKTKALEAYAKLPAEIKTKNMEYAFKIEEPNENETLEDNIKVLRQGAAYLRFLVPLNKLIENGVINVDEDTPLEEIVKLLQ